MPAFPTRRHRGIRLGLRSKILLFGGVPIILTLFVVVGFSLWSMYVGVIELSKNSLQQAVESAAKEIERANHWSLTIPKTMALAQSNGMFGDRAASIDYAKAVLEANPALTGSYFGYEPNADMEDIIFLRERGGGTTPAGNPIRSALNDQGRFIPYWFRNVQDDALIQLEPLVDMETSYYYQGSKNRFLRQPESQGIGEQKDKNSRYWTAELEAQVPQFGIMTEPYIYVNKFIVEQTYPIVVGGQFKGIAGVDRSLRSLQEFIWSLKPFQTAEFVVISRRGRIVVAQADRNVDTTQAASAEELDKITLQGDRIENTPEAAYLTEVYTRGTQAPKKVDIPGRGTYWVTGYRLKDEYGGWTVAMRVSDEEINAPFYEALWKTLIMAAVGLAIVVFVLFFLSRTISERVKRAASAARRVAEGDLTIEMQSDCDDEAGQLLGDIGNMVSDLNSLVGQVKRSSVELISTATQINAASRQQEASVNNFGSSTNEVTAAVKEISATSQELVKTMDDVTEVANETASLADAGRSSLGGMEGTMRGLSEATGSISSKLNVINEKSNNIGSVITTITKVADQTNLLSLNAAIEAEKAGEYGLGFAVVAREIRRLADQTAQATLDIEQMVKEMQSSVSSGVMEMDKFKDEVRRGVQETATLSQQFSRIIEQVQALTPRFETVHEGMQSQSQGAAQISEAMGQLTESARASANSLKEFNQAAEKLQHAVQALKEEVSRFKVR